MKFPTRRAIHAFGAIVALVVAWTLRVRAVNLLPIDYDEDDYLRAGQLMAADIRKGDWANLLEENYRPEHPPLAKLAYGLALTTLPDADIIPDRAVTASPAASLPQPHLRVARTLGAVFGSLQVFILGLVSPLAGLFLAVHTFTIKYTSQVMLEALPALTSTLCVLAYVRWQASGARHRHAWLAVSAVMLGFTAASKYMYALVGIIILIQAARKMLAESRQPIHVAIRPLLLWGLGAVGVFFICNPFLWPDPLGRLWESVAYHGGYATSEQVEATLFPIWQPMLWLVRSVPWHPDVFIVSFDGLIALFALAGLGRLNKRNAIFTLWLGLGMAFLFLWPTKWPQYILLLTAPLCLAAAEGFRRVIGEPVLGMIATLRKDGIHLSTPGLRWQDSRKALGWILPGGLLLLLITFFPLLYQGGMALTDFNATSIRDGINGGIRREVIGGLTGQIEPVPYEVFSFSRTGPREVSYTGFRPLLAFARGAGVELLMSEIIWTLSAISLQTALGVTIALLVNRRGVRFKGLWQAMFILPWAIPEFIGGLTWSQILDPRFGWFLSGGAFPDRPGFQFAQNLATWQENPAIAFVVMLIVATWMGFPLLMLAASAGLKMIPRDIYEAAALDGASGWQQFRHVTWPLLLPLLLPAIILRGIYAFNQFYLFYVLNPPYPLTTFAAASYFFVDFGGKYATSAVINVFTVVVLILFLLWFNRRSQAGKGVTYA